MSEQTKRMRLSSHPLFDDEVILRQILSFLPNTFRYNAAVNTKFRNAYAAVHDDSKDTSYENALQSVPTARICYQEGGNVRTVAEKAVTAGKLTVLQAMHNEGVLFTEHNLCALAAGEGHLIILQWLRSIECGWNLWTCRSAAKGGHLNVLQWARTNGCDWDEWTCSGAAESGNLEMLQWARANGCDWDARTCSAAAMRGNLELLQWARGNGCDWNEWTCAFAALSGNLEMLQWARANGCEWNSWTSRLAAQNGHLHILRWAQANGCDLDYRALELASGYGGQLLQWAIDNGYQP